MPTTITPADLLDRMRKACPERVRWILLQEQRLGYRDRGALGGIHRFVDRY